jgi:hypothetical protein
VLSTVCEVVWIRGKILDLELNPRKKPNALFSSDKKTLGQFYVLETNYQQTKNISFSFDASYFEACSYPKATGKGKDVTYLSFKSTFKF